MKYRQETHNGRGAVDSADRIAEPGLSETYGWGIPVASNSFKRVGLSTKCYLNGIFTLSLDGTAGAVRIWATGSPGSGDTPLLVSGQTVTNGVNGADFAEYGDTVLFVEALSNTTATLTYRYRGTGTAAGIACEAPLKMTTFGMALIPDYDRDGAVGDTDRQRVATNEVFRFWVNDDKDSGNVAVDDSDVPGQTNANCDDAVVNGRCDLLDFFPVWLDLKRTLDFLPEQGVVYKLRNAGGALRLVYTGLTKGQAGSYLKEECQVCGLSFDQNASGATTVAVPPEGVELPSAFLNLIRNDGQKGVLMMEGAAETQSPLVLEVLKDGQMLCKAVMPQSISGVEKMYRCLNLRPVAGDDRDVRGLPVNPTGDPTNNPDSSSNGKNVVFIHGFNESPDSALANICETFKRLYRSGCKAKFTGVEWYGDAGYDTLVGAKKHYHWSVTNAFVTAPAFAQYLSSLQGEVNVIAFSLGNMVVSSAIKDYGAQPDKYFMLHAAIAREAYETGQTDFNMREVEWRSYTNRLYASEWHSLFPDNDGRNKLSWHGRFDSVAGPQLYNYYSSGDEVLDNLADGGANINVLIAAWNLYGRYAWCMQELWKGRHPDWMGGSTYGGWGFNHQYDVPDYTNEDGQVFYKLLPPGSAADIPSDQLRTNMFFNTSSPVSIVCQDPDNPDGAGSQYATNNRGVLLAEMIPAISFATGSNPIGSLSASHNINMQHREENGQVVDQGFQNGWPDERSNNSDEGNRWLHGDYRTVAFCYVYQLFDDIVKTKGHLDQ